jgi:presqualene diphosphate synthase
MSMASSAETNLQPAASSSFYVAMRILPRERRQAMLSIYGFCRAVDDIADEPAISRDDRLRALAGWRSDLESLYRGGPAGRAASLAEAIAAFDLELADFVAVIEGMEMDVYETIQAPSWASLDLYCDRVASAVGRLSVRVFGVDRQIGVSLAHHLGRALQLTNILRDLDEDAAIDRLYLPREELAAAGIEARDPAAVLADARVGAACVALAQRARERFRDAINLMNQCPRASVRAPRMMAEVYAAILDRLCARGWSAPRARVRTPKHRVLLAVLRHGIL